MPQEVGRQKVISREIIEQHAEDLFIKQGVEKTSVNEIVKQAGIAKGTFYLYFKNKDELVDSIISSYTKDFLNKVLIPHGSELKIKKLSIGIMEYFNNNPFYLIELRRNLTSGNHYSSTKRTIEAFRAFVTMYINKLEEYEIQDWDSYTSIILGMILDVSFRTLIKNPGASSEVSVFGEVAAKPRRVQSLHPHSKLRSIPARRINGKDSLNGVVLLGDILKRFFSCTD